MSYSEYDGECGPNFVYPNPEDAMRPYVHDPSRYSGFQNERDDEDNERATAHYSTDAAGHHESFFIPSSRQPTDPFGFGSEESDTEEEEEVEQEAALEAHLGTEAESETKPNATLGGFTVASIAKKMKTIDLNNETQVGNLIRKMLTESEYNSLIFSEVDQQEILSPLPKNQRSIDTMAMDQDMIDSIQRYKELVSRTLDNLMTFMLAIGSRHDCPSESSGWLLALVSNAEAKSRQHLVSILTHPSAQPLHLQYRMGQPR
jgi:hypothetical protein